MLHLLSVKYISPLILITVITLILTCYFINAEEGRYKLLWERELNASVLGVCWSPDGEKLVVVGNFKEVIVFNRNGEILWRTNVEYPTSAPTISSDGKFLMIGAGWNLRIYDLAMGKQLYEVKLDHWIYSTSWSPNGRYMVVGCSGGYLYLFNRDDSRVSYVWYKRIAEKYISSVYFHPSGKWIIAGSDDFNIYFIDLNGNTLWRTKLNGRIHDIYLSSNGREVIAVTDEGTLYILGAGNGEILMKQEASRCLIDVIWYGDVVILGDESGYVYFYKLNESNGKKLNEVYKFKASNDQIAVGYGLSYNPRYNLLAIASHDKHVYVYDVNEVFTIMATTITKIIIKTVTLWKTTTIEIPGKPSFEAIVISVILISTGIVISLLIRRRKIS